MTLNPLSATLGSADCSGMNDPWLLQEKQGGGALDGQEGKGVSPGEGEKWEVTQRPSQVAFMNLQLTERRERVGSVASPKDNAGKGLAVRWA